MNTISTVNASKPFVSIKQASMITGLSQRYLRQGCIDGTVPHVMSGCKHLVNVPALLRQLDAVEGEAK